METINMTRLQYGHMSKRLLYAFRVPTSYSAFYTRIYANSVEKIVFDFLKIRWNY